MKYFIIAIIVGVLSTALFSCRENKKGKMSTNIVYHDVKMLGKILDFSQYAPDKAMFKYVPVLSSMELNGHKPSALGPEDYMLEAVMYFNPDRMEAITNKVKSEEVEWENKNHLVKSFNFAWLPEATARQINTRQDIKKYPASIFFHTGTAYMIIMGDTVIIYALTR